MLWLALSVAIGFAIVCSFVMYIFTPADKNRYRRLRPSNGYNYQSRSSISSYDNQPNDLEWLGALSGGSSDTFSSSDGGGSWGGDCGGDCSSDSGSSDGGGSD